MGLSRFQKVGRVLRPLGPLFRCICSSFRLHCCSAELDDFAFDVLDHSLRVVLPCFHTFQLGDHPHLGHVGDVLGFFDGISHLGLHVFHVSSDFAQLLLILLILGRLFFQLTDLFVRCVQLGILGSHQCRRLGGGCFSHLGNLHHVGEPLFQARDLRLQPALRRVRQWLGRGGARTQFQALGSIVKGHRDLQLLQVLLAQVLARHQEPREAFVHGFAIDPCSLLARSRARLRKSSGGPVGSIGPCHLSAHQRWASSHVSIIAEATMAQSCKQG
mmetsp:Transcript_28209/g.67081  ORF Transcript_28209/g.67081 Transcript_28209/m.67081 type:complete len:273 (-) Transcript_28209:78-896(-)